ncbi:MAG TPA: hypothetical protein VHZ02_19150 [Acidimicrobiales bacterium]|nr:hypothetical protein [Acidimicrobiales bacterium]
MIVHVLILWGVFGAAAALAVLLHTRRRTADAPEYQSSLTFVGASYGLLLGLLVVFAVGHYNDVQSVSQQEASSLVSLYDTVGVYPTQTRNDVRHQLVCYMRSIVQDEWPSMERGSELEAPRTLGFGDQLRADLRALPTSTTAQGSAYGRSATLISDAASSRQRLLFFTEPRIPTALWVVIYAGAFVVFLLLVGHYASRPVGRISALATVAVLMTVVVAVLAMLDQPYGLGVHAQPNQMRQAINLVLVGEKSPVVLQACQ